MNTPNLSVAKWRKSSYTSDTGGQCVELAAVESSVVIRDSKDPDGPKLVFSVAQFATFGRRIQAAEISLSSGEEYI